MTIEERYELSCYEELAKLEDAKNVWLVRHNETGTLYVKKRMQLYNRAVYQRLMMSHFQNIPQVVFCAEEESELIVVEEYIHGLSLEKMLVQEGVFSEEKVADIMIKLCDTIRPLHVLTPPIIHRDIKPSNIMISSEGIVKLIDFNAAKEFTPGQNEDTRLMGTRKFAAPEQYGFGQSDPRTDIYALGATMYYLLTKQFPESNLYHGRMLPIIEKCMEIDKNRRYASIQELQKDLIKAIHGKETRHDDGNVETASTTETKDTLFERSLYGYREKLPVGFRSGVLWKMILSVFGYMFIVWLSFTTVIKNSDGIALTGYPLWLNRMAIFLVLMGSVFFLGNYCNIRYQLPLMKKDKKLHWIMAVVYLILYFFMVITVLVILGGNG